MVRKNLVIIIFILFWLSICSIKVFSSQLENKIKHTPRREVLLSEKRADCRMVIVKRLKGASPETIKFTTNLFLPLYRVYQADSFFDSDFYFPSVITFFGVILCIFAAAIFGKFLKVLFFALAFYLVLGYFILY